MEMEANRRKALAMQAQYFPGGVTRTEKKGPDDVTGTPGPRPSAAEGRGGRGGKPDPGKKIAGLPAAARAPEAAPRGTGESAAGGPVSGPNDADALKRNHPAAEPAEIDRTKPDRRENELMMNLMVLRNTLVRNAPAARERAKRAGKWVWRDLRLMLRLVIKTQEALLQTMPESRRDYYTAYAMNGHYELRMDGPVRTPRHVLITDVHLGSITEAAMGSECVMCLREGSEIGKCPLREALLEVAPPTELQEGHWRKCEYRGAAGDLIQGRDVEI